MDWWLAVSSLARVLFGLVLILGALQSLVQDSRGPVSEADLNIAGGQLSDVTPCSTGRNARFNYRVDTQEGPVESWVSCPSPLQREVAARMGQTVAVKYRNERDWLLMPRLKVYELRVDNGALWSVAETVGRQQSVRGLKQAMTVLTLLAGGLLVLLGLRSLSSKPSSASRTPSA